LKSAKYGYGAARIPVDLSLMDTRSTPSHLSCRVTAWWCPRGSPTIDRSLMKDSSRSGRASLFQRRKPTRSLPQSHRVRTFSFHTSLVMTSIQARLLKLVGG